MSTDDPTVIVTDASGVEHKAFATSGIEGKGHTFPVIWVSFERGGQSIPWPAEFVGKELRVGPAWSTPQQVEIMLRRCRWCDDFAEAEIHGEAAA